MDLFEFTQVLRRQRKLLIGGVILIVAAIAILAFELNDGSVAFRAKPRYEASVQIAVVPVDFDSLASSLPNAGAMAGAASLYGTLLASPEATIEISEGTGVQLVQRLQIGTTGRDGFIAVKATARDPEGAIQAALHSYTWLEQRLADPLSVVYVGQSDSGGIGAGDEQGQYVGTIHLDASPAFAETATGLWISLRSSDSTFTASLADAAGQALEYVARLEPEGNLVLSLEDISGNELDAALVPIPPVPGPSDQYALRVRLDRGTLIFPAGDSGSNAELDARRVDVSWQLSPTAAGVAATSEGIGLLLLTEEPVALITGSRRGPVLIIAALVGGLFALVALVVAIDTWSQAKRALKVEPSTAFEAAEPLEAVEPLEAEDSGLNWRKVQNLESANPWEAK